MAVKKLIQRNYKENIFSGLLLLFVLLWTISCHDVNDKTDKFYSKELCSENHDALSIFSNRVFFAFDHEDRLLILDIKTLRDIYKKQYKSISCTEFLNGVFGKEILINVTGYDLKSFKINETVKINYNKGGVDLLLKLYSVKVTEERFVLKNKLDLNINYSVLYYLFENGNKIFLDDYAGAIIICKNDLSKSP